MTANVSMVPVRLVQNILTMLKATLQGINEDAVRGYSV